MTNHSRAQVTFFAISALIFCKANGTTQVEVTIVGLYLLVKPSPLPKDHKLNVLYGYNRTRLSHSKKYALTTLPLHP